MKSRQLLLWAIALVSGLSSCSPDTSFVYLDGAVWNTTYSIKYRGSQNLADSVQIIMKDVELSLSPFNSESTISHINNNESMAVDSNIKHVFTLSKQINSISRGAFDPTLSPLINLWGFGYTGNEPTEPSDSMIAATLASVGIDSCEIIGDIMTKKSPDTTFNFSAITKGYGCDAIAAMLQRNGVNDYLIEIGGEIALSGHNDRGKLWRVMIDAPVEAIAGHTGMTTVELSDCCIATSGNYRNYRDTTTGRIGHTISATTGRPVVTSTLSVTVIAPDCATADALATACMAMPADSAIAMIDRLLDTKVILVTRAADGSLDVISHRL